MIEGAQGTAYVNGDYVPLAQARVSVLDRGFLFADGVYEVAAVIDGLLVDSDSHLARLARSARELAIPLPLGLAEIEAVQKEIVRANALAEGLVYLQLTRGADVTRDFLAPMDLKPTLVLFAQPRPVAANAAVARGIAVKSMPDLRWARRDIKSVGLLAQALAKREAAAAGCQEAMLLEGEVVTEGASSTFHIVTADDVIVTRPNSNSVLPGCTSAAVAALAGEQGLAIARRAFTLAEARAAKEVFITSASTFVMPVVTIDGAPVAGGVPGPLALRLRDLYLAFARRTGR
jgi:D-alanine transaminase